MFIMAFIRKRMRGVFTKKAKAKGKSVQAYAREVIKKYKGTGRQTRLLRQAVFARNAGRWAKRRKK